jgi:EAL domain-containing protein (putative c-di-GMP-specific phosphodiesterase class I)
VIRDLGAWVLRQACRDGLAWPSLVVGVNVSPIQFRDPDFCSTVRGIADAAGMPLERLELEVTEGAYFDDVERALVELKRLRALGVQIALDDFGTGYASLTYLRRLPFTKVKIDKSFVDECQSVGAAAIIHAVIAMSRALGLKVTAEGVETEEQRRFLRAAGCHYLQGYLFARPLPAREITARLAAPQSARTA